MPNIFRVIMVLGWMGIFPASGVQPWLEGKEWNALEEASSGGNVSEWDMYRVLDQCGEADVSRNQEKGEIIIQCPARQDGTATPVPSFRMTATSLSGRNMPMRRGTPPCPCR